MNSTDISVLPLKLILGVISIVVILHVLTAMALVAIKPPTPVSQPPIITQPIDIKMVTPVIKIKEIETQIDVKPESKTDDKKPTVNPEPQSKPVVTAESKPKTVRAKEPEQPARASTVTPVMTAPAIPATTTPKRQSDTVDIVQNEPFMHEVARGESTSITQTNTLATTKERQILAAQAERAIQKRAQADEARLTTIEAKRGAQKQAEEAATRQAEIEAAEKATQDKIAAANNTPVNFNASHANWASTPNFSFPNRATRGTRSGDTFNVVLVLRVNKQGGIDSVRLLQSSGIPALDKEAQRQVRSGTFKPFTKNGVPVVGNVTLPISYAVP